MSDPARSIKDLPEPSGGNTIRRVSPNLPIILNAQQLATAQENIAAAGGLPGMPLRYIGTQGDEEKKAARKESGVLRGIKDLQQLQKQTIAVLESVKANLEDIQQVLRSPEATRGLEKQQNAATLLSKGFARDAVEQALGAVALLPANPEAHLLLSLSLAADQQFDASLGAARKGLALFDRRTHPLAIEAGLLHALAALGCGAEAVERWAVIIDALPIPVLLEHIGRVAACFPADAPVGQLDEMLTARLTREPEPQQDSGRRGRSIETRPGEIPATALFAGLDASHYARLATTHRAILAQVARRLNDTKDSTDILRFLTECVIPLGNMDLDRSASALGRASVKRLLRCHADAMALHRAMTKLEMAGAMGPAAEIATLLRHWWRAGSRVARARRMLILATGLFAGGVAMLAYVLFAMDVIHGKQVMMTIGRWRVEALWVGPGFIGLGSLLGIFALMGRTWSVALPEGRPRLSVEELRFIRSAGVKQSVRAVLRARRK